MVSEAFPEAFERFEKDVNVDKIKTFSQLELAFESWYNGGRIYDNFGGVIGFRKWRGTPKQETALEQEARSIGIPIKARREYAVKRVRHARRVYTGKEFSRSYDSYAVWLDKRTRTTAYQQRIILYMQKHPDATLAQARGHSLKKVIKK